MVATKRDIWAESIARDCLRAANGDEDAALLAIEIILSTQPMPVEVEVAPPAPPAAPVVAVTPISAPLAFDIHNRKAQGILNRALQSVRGISTTARKELEAALKLSGNGSGEAIINFVDKYRVGLARVLTQTQLAALLEGASEVSAKVPPLGEVPVEGLPVKEQERILEARKNKPAPIDVPRVKDSPEDIHYVTIDEAVKNLQQREVMDRQQFDSLEAAARAKAFTVANVGAQETLTKIRDSLAQNVKEGVDYATWSKKVLEEVDQGTFLSDAHQENVFRTNVQTAFSDGQMAVLSHPLVRSGFPYSIYDSIHDDRRRVNHGRLEHLGIQGTNVYRNDDPVFQMFRPPWDYQDRCGWTPITVRHAAERGVKEAQVWMATGIEPAQKAFVPMPDFQPPEGFKRSIVAAPLSIQLSMQPMTTFAYNGPSPNVAYVAHPTPTPQPPIPEEEYPRNAARQFLDKHSIVEAANDADVLTTTRESLPEDQRYKLDHLVLRVQSGGTVHHPREHPNFGIDIKGEIADPTWRDYADTLDRYLTWQEDDATRTIQRSDLGAFTKAMRDRSLTNKTTKVIEATHTTKDIPARDVRSRIVEAIKAHRDHLRGLFDQLDNLGATDAEQRAVDHLLHKSAVGIDRLVYDYTKQDKLVRSVAPLVDGILRCADEVDELFQKTINEVHSRIDKDVADNPEPPEPEEPPSQVQNSAAFAVHWVTIGGHPEGDVKHKGGFPVELDGAGNIIKGRLRGTNVSNARANLKRKGGGNGQHPRQQQPGSSIGRGGQPNVGGPQGTGGPVAGAAGRPGHAAVGGDGQGADQPAGAQAAGNPSSNLRVSKRLKLNQINRRLKIYTEHFKKNGQKDVVEWMGLLRQHINEVGVESALAALGDEPTGHTGDPVGKVQYKGTAMLDEQYMDKGELSFIKSYLDRSGIVYQGIAEVPNPAIRTIASHPLPAAHKGVAKPGSVVPTESNITDKLQESKLLPGLESTEDIHKVVGANVTAFTPEVLAKLDAKYGAGKWIVKPYGDEAFASFGVLFPQRIKELQKSSKETIWDVGRSLKKHGYTLARDETGTVVGLSKAGTEYRFGSAEYETISNKTVKKLGKVAAASAPSEKAAQLPVSPEVNLKQNFGITLRKGPDGKVVGITTDEGKDLEWGSKEAKELDDDIGHHIERSVDAVNSGQPQDSRFLVQPAFPAVGVSELDRAEGNTWETSNEGRVHVTTRGGKASVIPFATLANRGDGLPATFYNQDIRDMEKAVQDAIDALPDTEKTGQVYAPDVMRTKDGWRVVELNASMEGGQSLWLEENPFVIDAYVSHSTGREPAHVRFIRNLLKDKMGASRLPLKPPTQAQAATVATPPIPTPVQPVAPVMPAKAPAPVSLQGKAMSFNDDHPRKSAGKEGGGQFVKKGQVGAVRTVKYGAIKASYATFTKKKIDGPSIKLKNYVQQDEHSCGFVAALTIARYFEPQVSAKNVLRVVEPLVYGGVDRKQMRKALRKLGVETTYRSDLTIKMLKKAVEKGIPIIISVWPDEWDTDHWTVVQGFDEDGRVYLTNHRSLSKEDFKRQWIENWKDGSTTGAGLICSHDPGYEEDEGEDDEEEEFDDIEDDDEEDEEEDASLSIIGKVKSLFKKPKSTDEQHSEKMESEGWDKHAVPGVHTKGNDLHIKGEGIAIGEHNMPKEWDKAGREHENKLGNHEKAMVQDYSRHGYGINKELREGGAGSLVGHNKTKYGAINSAIDKASHGNEKEHEVYRGMRLSPEEHDKMMESARHAHETGGHLQFGGVQSSSLNPKSAAGFAANATEGKRGLMFKIHSREGLHMNSLTKFRGEAEYLMKHNSKYKVKGFGTANVNGEKMHIIHLHHDTGGSPLALSVDDNKDTISAVIELSDKVDKLAKLVEKPVEHKPDPTAIAILEKLTDLVARPIPTIQEPAPVAPTPVKGKVTKTNQIEYDRDDKPIKVVTTEETE